MNTRLPYETSSSSSIVVAAALAAIFSIGILTGVVIMFEGDGMPFEQITIAERACASHAYVSEREACLNEWLAARRAQSVAKGH